MDGGVARRLRCVPYEAVFVDTGDERLLAGAPHVHPRDRDLARNFPRWKLAAMKRILLAPSECPDPPKVVAQTRALMTREDRIRAFLDETIVRTGLSHACLGGGAACVRRRRTRADARAVVRRARELELARPPPEDVPVALAF